MHSKKSSFSLLEILIVIAIVILLLAGLFLIFDPMSQINKANDSKRTSSLAMLKNALEDYYNDKNCYPTLAELCYLGGDNGDTFSDKTSCYICGNESQPPSFDIFKPYLKTLPCDPNHPLKKFLYQIQGSSSCPNAYRIYTDFSSSNNPQSLGVDCWGGGCGIPPDFGYDYGISSENILIERSGSYNCYTPTNTCDNCRSYTKCKNNFRCLDVFATFDLCCKGHPQAIGCK